MEYIKKIPSLISSLQGNHVLKRVQKKRESGEIQSQAEFQEVLRNELIKVNEIQGDSTFTFRPIQSGIAYSEAVNTSMESILENLQIAYSEINYLFTKIASHELFFDRSVKEIGTLTRQLEAKLEELEIEAGLDTAYDKVFNNNFSDASDRMSIANPVFNELYFDTRTKKNLSKSSDLLIDSKVGFLTLPKFSESEVAISSVSIVETETTATDYDISLPDSNPLKVITDGETEVWTYNVLKNNKIKTGASLTLEIDMGDKKEVNSLMIEPNTQSPVFLEEVTFVDDTDTEENIEVKSRVLDSTVILNFPTVIARRFRIKLRQEVSTILSYDVNNSGYTLQDIQRDQDIKPTVSMLSTEISEEMKDPTIKNILSVNGGSIPNEILLSNYSFSLSRVRAGYSDYEQSGVFISRANEAHAPELISFETLHNIDTFYDPEVDLDLPIGSIEYSIVKRDFDGQGRLLRVREFNILPLGQDSIEDERMHFDIDKIQALRFLGHRASDNNGEGVRIYRNGEELIRGLDWRFKDREDVLDAADPILEPGLTKTYVEILHTQDQIKEGRYTAGYQPRFAMEPDIETVDNGVVYLPSGATEHKIDVFGVKIEKSELYVKTIIRNNTDSGEASPQIDYYRLLLKEGENNDE